MSQIKSKITLLTGEHDTDRNIFVYIYIRQNCPEKFHVNEINKCDPPYIGVISKKFKRHTLTDGTCDYGRVKKNR